MKRTKDADTLDGNRPKTGKRGKHVVLIVLSAVLGVVVGGTAGLAAAGVGPFSGLTTTVEMVTVPNLEGLTQEEASSRLRQVGLTAGENDEVITSDAEPGTVVYQAIEAGVQVAAGSPIGFTLMSETRNTTTTTTSHTYTLVSQAMTWQQAEAYCEAHGGHLATISSAAEYQKVLAAVQEGDVIACWIGCYRYNDTWRWVDGQAFSYSAWAENEPNNEGGDEDYVALFKRYGEWGWYDCPNNLSTTYQAEDIGFVMEQDG